MVSSTLLEAVTTRSQPSTRSAPATPARMAWIWSAVLATRMWQATAPPFWARPVMSMEPKPLPSRWAAWPSTADMVTTPVPPTPVTSMV